MKKIQIMTVLAMVALASGLTGCAMFNKGTLHYTLHYTRTTTIGKELMDLQDARAKGAITEEEYAKVKKEILKGGPMTVEGSCKEAE